MRSIAFVKGEEQLEVYCQAIAKWLPPLLVITLKCFRARHPPELSEVAFARELHLGGAMITAEV